MASQIRRAFRTTKIKMAAFPEEARHEIESLFVSLEAARTDAVEAERDAIIAAQVAASKRARAIQAEMKLIKVAATFSQPIATERAWTVYHDKEGSVVFEGITESLIRNNLRAQQAMLGRQVSEGEGEIDRDDLYEDTGEEESQE